MEMHMHVGYQNLCGCGLRDRHLTVGPVCGQTRISMGAVCGACNHDHKQVYFEGGWVEAFPGSDVPTVITCRQWPSVCTLQEQTDPAHNESAPPGRNTSSYTTSRVNSAGSTHAGPGKLCVQVSRKIEGNKGKGGWD